MIRSDDVNMAKRTSALVFIDASASIFGRLARRRGSRLLSELMTRRSIQRFKSGPRNHG